MQWPALKANSKYPVHQFVIQAIFSIKYYAHNIPKVTHI